EIGIPVLGICYGELAMCVLLGGKVEAGHEREFGRAFLEIQEENALFDEVWEKGSCYQVWMSHGDRVTALPEGFRVIGTSKGAPYAAIADEKRHFYAVQFQPEVVHTPDGTKLLQNFVHKISGLKSNWSMTSYRKKVIADIREKVGKSRVICGLSGGVDSTVVAVLLHEAIGEQLTCIFVGHGLIHKNETEEILTLFRDHYNVELIHANANNMFHSALEDERDPEE
ncbi:glutamine amidotransferase-related protein, partial [Bartonella grahamii]|uniref:glutamine amidotransferase-related protein n=1 Tax=Bartonella grahamii TaxID=33045 RepID=UPI001ABAC109